MRSDTQIALEVQEELKWHPDLDADYITISVKAGVVTLMGAVRSYADKYNAKRTVARIAGVSGISDRLVLRLPKGDERSDLEIARDANTALKTRLRSFAKNINVAVHDGIVALEGRVTWHFQRQAADAVVRKLNGVKGVDNRVQLQPETTPQALTEKIVDALRRDALLDSSGITVETHDGEVVLSGSVRSWNDRDEAERVAWLAPGVTDVIDEIAVWP